MPIDSYLRCYERGIINQTPSLYWKDIFICPHVLDILKMLYLRYLGSLNQTSAQHFALQKCKHQQFRNNLLPFRGASNWGKNCRAVSLALSPISHGAARGSQMLRSRLGTGSSAPQSPSHTEFINSLHLYCSISIHLKWWNPHDIF